MHVMSKILIVVLGVIPAGLLALGSLMLVGSFVPVGPQLESLLILPAFGGLAGLIWTAIGLSRNHTRVVLGLLILGELGMLFPMVALLPFLFEENPYKTWTDYGLIVFLVLGPVVSGLASIGHCMRMLRPA